MGRFLKIYIGIGLLIILIGLLVILSKELNLLKVGHHDVEKDVLTIHSPLNERIIIPILKEFTETTGIQVEYTSAGTLELLETLETKGDKYLMDVIWGGSEDYLNVYSDLFEPISLEENTNPFVLDFNQLPIVLIYNTKLVAEEEVSKTWHEILDPKWQGKLAIADPESSGSAYIALSFLLEMDGGEGYNWENAKKLWHNVDGKMLAKSSEVYNGVASGDFAIGISMEEAAINLIHQGEDIGIVYLEEGTPVIDDSIAMLKDAKHKEEAKTFIEFVLSNRVQTYMVERFYLRSVHREVKVPDGLDPMEVLNIYDASKLTTFSNKDKIISQWHEIISKEDE